MTIRIPKGVLWLLGVLAVAVVVLAAYLAGRSSSVDPPVESGSTTTDALACNRAAFSDAVSGTELETEARRIVSPEGELIGGPDGFSISYLICADLDGDGQDEMTGALAIGAAGRTGIYGIFRQIDGTWRPVFVRAGLLISDLQAREGGLAETVSTFGVDDPLCCPSGSRVNRIIAADDGYRVVVTGASPDRGLVIDESAGASELGPLQLREGAGPTQATAAFGAPTSATSGDPEAQTTYLCDYSWNDLGLHISFVNLGGSDACSDGLVQSFSLDGLTAEQAGWQTADGVHAGMTQRQLARLYPFVSDLAPTSKAKLIRVYTPIGDGGFQELLVAELVGGRVRALESFVGAAGE